MKERPVEWRLSNEGKETKVGVMKQGGRETKGKMTKQEEREEKRSRDGTGRERGQERNKKSCKRYIATENNIEKH